MRAPLFWHDNSLLSKLLLPYSWAYGAGHRLRSKSTHTKSVGVPVICIGNLVAGGAGKTPITLALAKKFITSNKKVFLLTRGHGGALRGPVLMDGKQSPDDVGDETLLLERSAPTVMSKHRVQGAELAINSGAEIIIMDDGFQNQSLKKDFSILVVDGHYGFGNGHLIPAGPLRESLESGFARADAFILIGEDRHNLAPMLSAKHPVIRAHTELDASMSHLKGQRVVAFAGIGTPEKFFRSLQEFGCEVKNTNGFPDHYKFKEADIVKLKGQAKDRQALLVTTEKDFVRIPEAWREGIIAVPARVVFENEAVVTKLIAPFC